MKSEATKAIGPEEDRQQRVEELIAENGPTWFDAYKPGSFGCHELLDRISMLGDTVEEFVLDHPACLQNPEWYALADQAVVSLRELYQRVGGEHLGKD
jgi:hypothetical protein